MRPEELTALLRTRPFVPLRFHLTDGRTFDLHHPDNIMVLRSRVDVGVEADPVSGVVNRVEHWSLLHIVRIEELAESPEALP